MALSKPMQMLSAATAAGVGGFLSTTILYPLDTLKTRMQSGKKAFEDEKTTDGQTSKNRQLAMIKSLYQGYQYKTAESTVSKFFYFYAYTLLSQLVTPQDGQPISTTTNLVIGYLSEFVHLPVTLPMEVIATRLQTSAKGSGGGNLFQVVQSVKKESGIAGFYKGFHAYFVLCLQPAIQYTVFEKVKAFYLARFKQAADSLGALEAFILGAVARSIATLLLFPYIRAKVILQAKKKSVADATERDLEHGQASAAPAKQDGIISTLQHVYRDEGVLSLYRGLGPELTKGALSSAFMLMIKEKIQAYITMILILANSHS